MSIEQLLNAKFQIRLMDNEMMIEQILEQSVDLQKRKFVFYDTADLSGLCIYTDGLVDIPQVELILKSLIVYGSQLEGTDQIHDIGNMIREQLLFNASLRLVTKVEDGIDGILSGDSLILLDQCSDGILVSTRGWDARSIEEPATEGGIRGPRDGFTESIRTNTSQVRRRIRDPLLRIEAMKIGKKSKTDVNVAYLKGTVKEGLVDEVKSRLEGLAIDAILESGYIEELIKDSPLSPFKTIQSTERPDKVASAILEGRVAIFIDNTPFVLIVPVSFWQYLQAADDYYLNYWNASFFRLLRFFALFISFTLPSVYVMLVSFHQEMIPTDLALSIASGREVVPFPVLLEMLLLEFVFELIREAGLRMPKAIGQAVSIVGTLVIGQAAVQAGLVSPFMVIIVAITGISSFVIPNYEASITIRLLRFPLLIVSGFLGLLGFSAGFLLLLIHLLSIRSFGEPFIGPIIPFHPSELKDFVIRFPWWSMKKRPGFAQGDRDRISEGQMPQPPTTKQQSGQENRSNRKP
ncbi:spore germination protein [Paenibacillus baekrokdamisoli]|nr:spore germination protein [Paenibacillus baekrokdamisoli]